MFNVQLFQTFKSFKVFTPFNVFNRVQLCSRAFTRTSAKDYLAYRCDMVA